MNLGRFIFFRIEKGLRLNFGSEFLKSVRVLLKNLDYSEEKLPGVIPRLSLSVLASMKPLHPFFKHSQIVSLIPEKNAIS